MGVRIEGTADLARCLDKASENFMKMSVASMKVAGRKVAGKIRREVPARFKKLVKSKVVKGNGQADTAVLMGLFSTKKKNGKAFDLFKAYWMNYGTLTLRDPGHQFARPVKKTVRRRNNKGQPALNFFEAAIEGWEDDYIRSFEDEMKKNENMLYDR